MKKRCLNPNSKDYPNYGGRGIRICKEWCADFYAFVEDVGAQPDKASQLDRINNDGNYEPRNIRWVTPTKNAANRPPNKFSGHYRGVESQHGSYRAAIGINRHLLRIGTYKIPDEAAWMYDQWALALFGDDAYTNFTYTELSASCDKL